jgi:two-component system sensor kinase FixL
MSDTSDSVKTTIHSYYKKLEEENKHLRQENMELACQAEDIAKANAHAAELMARLEEANEHLEAEIEKRKEAEQRLQQINRDIEAKVQQRTVELTIANERLTDEVNQREQIEQTLREHKQRLDTILSTLLTGVVIVDSETHEILDVNPLAAKKIGLPIEQIKGKVCHKFICPAEEGKCPISDLEQTIDKSERVLLRSDGEEVPILKTVTKAFWQGREYLVESFVDITERKQAEEHRNHLLMKLENANKELNKLMYIMSHDLKTPLRGISMLANWISKDYANEFSDEGQGQMNLLLRRVDRIYNLLDGILQYSQVMRMDEQKTHVDVDELVRDIIDMLGAPGNITITIENKLPVIECEETKITRVFQNLLNNAVKYMDKPHGVVKIGCVEEDGYWKFSIADNGPGIEEKYFDKIFQMFQTLSPRDEFESTGVGLTVVKKVVELYGGQLWVESEVGEGSTFLFTLPIREMGSEHTKFQSNKDNWKQFQ